VRGDTGGALHETNVPRDLITTTTTAMRLRNGARIDERRKVSVGRVREAVVLQIVGTASHRAAPSQHHVIVGILLDGQSSIAQRKSHVDAKNRKCTAFVHVHRDSDMSDMVRFA
jgi:hypothetical protein